jgi:hypothetical protein
MITGEKVIINFSNPNNITFYSNIQGDIKGKIHPGSDIDSFKLVSGENYLSSFFYTSGSVVDNVIVQWNNVELNILGEISRYCPQVSSITGSYPPVPVWHFLTEDGFYILTENLNKILTEDSYNV